MGVKIAWKFKNDFPLLGEWLDLEATRAYRLPEKVNRKNIARGQEYELTRYKTLFALLQAVQPMFKPDFNLKDFATLLNVSYAVIRRWSREERVKKKTQEYAEKFVNYFMNDLVPVLKDLEKNGSESDAHLAMQRTNLIHEAANFGGLIQEVFRRALIQFFEYAPDNRASNVVLLQFIESFMRSMRIVKPDTTINGIENLYKLSDEVKRKTLELHFDSLEDRLRENPREAIEIVRSVRADVLNIYKRGSQYQRKQLKEKPIEGRRQKTGLRDPVDKIAKAHEKFSKP